MKQLYVELYTEQYVIYQPRSITRYKNELGITLFTIGTDTPLPQALKKYCKTKSTYKQNKYDEYTVTLTDEEYKVLTHLQNTPLTIDLLTICKDYLQEKLTHIKFMCKLQTYITLKLLQKQPCN